jgi:hypothetical protein
MTINMTDARTSEVEAAKAPFNVGMNDGIVT